ncbi:MAG TPA: DUF4129 domain-containing protein [Myxococcales bacterium]|jgi:hypothetical protein
MSAVAPDLRPRGPAELYDAAVHLCTRGGTPLPALALVGAVLPAVSGLALAHRALTGRGYLPWAALFALCLMLRGLFAGAASLAGEACLEGNPITSWEALRKAGRRALSLMSAGGLAMLLEWVLVPATLFIGLVLWSSLYSGPALVARAEAGPWGMGKACRRRLANEPTFVVRLLHGMAFVVVAVNLASGIAMGLYLGRSLLGLDVTFFEQFASPRNPVYVLFVLALSAVVLEPIKVALGLLLLVDARVRSEGLDLLAAVERLSQRRAAVVGGAPKAAALALLLGALALFGAPASARADIDPQVEGDLSDLMADTGLEDDEDAQEGFEAARRLQGPEVMALRRFTERMREAREAGESHDELRKRLLAGLDEVRGLSSEEKPEPAADPRAAAQTVLAQPEFEAPPEKVDAAEEAADNGLFMRFLKWLWESLFGKPKPKTPEMELPGLPVGLFRVVAYVALGLAIGVLLFLIVRAFLLRQKEEAGEDEEEGGVAGGAGAKADQESALAKAPRGWWSDADALAAKGEYRAALRALYLSVLSSLHRRGAIDYDPTRSNWDYVRAFRGALEELPGFRELTRRFDFGWYGRLGADAQGYDVARQLARPLVEKGAGDA